MSDLDTALEGARADVSGGTGACEGQRAAAATWCEERIPSLREATFFSSGGQDPSKSRETGFEPKTVEAFSFGPISFSGNTTFTSMAICARYQKCGDWPTMKTVLESS